MSTTVPTSPLGASGGGELSARHHRGSAQLLDSQTYRQAVWADLSSDQSFISDLRSHQKGGRGARQRAVRGGTATSMRSDSAEELEMSDVTGAEGMLKAHPDICMSVVHLLLLPDDA